MKIRKITSLTVSLSFVLMVVTSIILFVVPQGRVAYWADWQLWGLTKTQWGNVHINFGLLFLISLFLHIYYNWKPLISYLKNKAKRLKVFTPEFNVALMIAIAFFVGTQLMVPPFSWVMSLNDHFKDAGAEKYGEPPYGHAELSSLKTFAKKMDLDLEKSMELLHQARYTVENSETTLAAIGRKYNIPPRSIYETIQPAVMASAKRAKSGAKMPESPPPGTGNLTLADLCTQFKLNMKLVSRELKKAGIQASEELTIKKIATSNQINPTDLYERIKDIVQK